ncbi:MAG: SLC13 family permease [Clostridia bacterium]|nr:SLC13 family permease [Clostridia bacterium]
MSFDIWIVAVCFVMYISAFFFGVRFLGLTSMLVMFILWVSNVLDFSAAFGSLADDTALTYIGIFIISTALTKTDFFDRLGGIVIKRAKTEFQFVIGLCALTALLSFFMEGPLIVVSAGPAVIDMCVRMNISPKRVMKPMNDIYCLYGSLLPLGGAATIYMVANRLIESYGGTPVLTLWTIPLANLPIAIIATGFILFSYKRMPADWDGVQTEDIEAYSAKNKLTSISKRVQKPYQQTVIYSVYIFVMAGIFSSKWTNLEIPIFTTIGAAIIVLSGAMTEKEAAGAIRTPMIALYAASIALANGLKASGGLEIIGAFLNKTLAGATNPYIIGGAVFLSAMVMTQFVSNSITKQLVRAVIIPMSLMLGWNVKGLFVLGFLGSNFAILTPMGSETSTMITALVGYKIKDYLKQGLFIFIIVLVSGSLIVPLIYPVF